MAMVAALRMVKVNGPEGDRKQADFAMAQLDPSCELPDAQWEVWHAAFKMLRDKREEPVRAIVKAWRTRVLRGSQVGDVEGLAQDDWDAMWAAAGVAASDMPSFTKWD
jgi:hypothetical protein